MRPERPRDGSSVDGSSVDVRSLDDQERAFADLTGRIRPATAPRLVVDLGCGDGLLTAALAERWPDAEVIGVDSQPQLIARAMRLAGGGLAFVRRLRQWRPGRVRPVHLVG